MEKLINNQTNMIENPSLFNLQIFNDNTKQINGLFEQLPKNPVKLDENECKKYSEMLSKYKKLNITLKNVKENPKLKAIIDYTYDMIKNVNNFLKNNQCNN